MTRKILYRWAEPHEALLITDFQVAMAMETEKMRLDAAICGAGVRAVFENPAYGRYLVCEVDGVVAGSLLLQNEWSDWRNGMVWWIHSLYIREEMRGLKLFSGMFAHVRALVEADPKIRGLRLYVDKTNTNAQAVYQKLGMNGDHYATYELMK